jgi:hypothetical protein
VGSASQSARRDAEWLRQHRPELQIVSDALWNAAHDRLKGIRANLQAKIGGQFPRRHARDVESRFLLTGFAR